MHNSVHQPVYLQCSAALTFMRDDDADDADDDVVNQEIFSHQRTTDQMLNTIVAPMPDRTLQADADLNQSISHSRQVGRTKRSLKEEKWTTIANDARIEQKCGRTRMSDAK